MSVQVEKGYPLCPEKLEEKQIQQFREDGFLAYEGIISSEEVEAARSALTEITVKGIEEAQRGEAEVIQPNKNATKNYSGVRIQRSNERAGIHFEPGFDPLAMSPEEAELKIRKLHGYNQDHPDLQSLVIHPKIKGNVEALMGYEAILRGDMALSKPPFIGSEKPWHQDNAYFVHIPLDSVITAWITLDDATVENGCMHVIPGGHKLGAFKHEHRIDCQIVEGRLDVSKAVPIELKAGGGMFFSGMLPHETPPNHTEKRRRALQFQYRGSNTLTLTREEFAKVFVEADGTPASCAVAERIIG